MARATAPLPPRRSRSPVDRSALHPARLAAAWEPVAALAAQLQALHRVAAPGVDMLTQVEADMQFHRLLCSGSGNPKFLAVFDQIAAETEFSIMVIGQLYDDPLKMAETHEPILDALQAGDAPRAEAAIRYHIGVAREMVTRQFRDLETGAG